MNQFICSVLYISHIIDKLPVESANPIMRRELTRNNQIHEVADHWLMFSNELHR